MVSVNGTGALIESRNPPLKATELRFVGGVSIGLATIGGRARGASRFRWRWGCAPFRRTPSRAAGGCHSRGNYGGIQDESRRNVQRGRHNHFRRISGSLHECANRACARGDGRQQRGCRRPGNRGAGSGRLICRSARDSPSGAGAQSHHPGRPSKPAPSCEQGAAPSPDRELSTPEECKPSSGAPRVGAEAGEGCRGKERRSDN